MKITVHLAATCAAVCLSASLPAAATVLLQDNFDSDSATTQLNFNSLTNWSVDGGTVDYIRDGTQGIRCLGNAGGCLDTDGFTSDAGRIVSKAVFTLSPLLTYTLDMQLSGNQRSGAADGLHFGLLDDFTGLAALSVQYAIGTFPADQPFSLQFVSFSGLSLDYSHGFRVFIAGMGGDNVGAVIDNLSFHDDSGRTVSLPGSGALAVVALLGLAVSRRRKPT